MKGGEYERIRERNREKRARGKGRERNCLVVPPMVGKNVQHMHKILLKLFMCAKTCAKTCRDNATKVLHTASSQISF